MTSNEQVLSDAAKAEIAAAVKIVASDKGYAMTQEIRNHLIPRTPENDPPKNGDPTPPPKNEPEPPGDPTESDTSSGGLWWSKDRLAE